MRLIVLTQSSSYSTRRFMEAGEDRGDEVVHVDPRDVGLVLGSDEPELLFRGGDLGAVDAVMPRDGAETTDHALAVVQQFQDGGVHVVNDARSIAVSRDKFRSLQRLHTHGVPVPRTVLHSHPEDVDAILAQVGGLPAVLKLRVGTGGVGVMIAETRQSLASILDVFWEMEEPVLVQEFVAESAGTDVRALVVGSEVVAGMRRQAKGGEFRANIHLGGAAEAVDLDEASRRVAVDAADLMGLDIAGVDLLQTQEGPKVIEVNSAPDFQGLESCTYQDIARTKLDYVARSLDAA